MFRYSNSLLLLLFIFGCGDDAPPATKTTTVVYKDFATVSITKDPSNQYRVHGYINRIRLQVNDANGEALEQANIPVLVAWKNDLCEICQNGGDEGDPNYHPTSDDWGAHPGSEYTGRTGKSTGVFMGRYTDYDPADEDIQLPCNGKQQVIIYTDCNGIAEFRFGFNRRGHSYPDQYHRMSVNFYVKPYSPYITNAKLCIEWQAGVEHLHNHDCVGIITIPSGSQWEWPNAVTIIPPEPSSDPPLQSIFLSYGTCLTMVDITIDSDGDGICDEWDGCPNDGYKLEPGECGCGYSENCVRDPDFDNDSDVDQDDFAFYQLCYSGEGVMVDLDCEEADLDFDGDIDSIDASLFEECRSGPGVLFDITCRE